jgi:hypothetical protein
MPKLTLADISDLRAYEREREDFRAAIIALKKKRRIGVGPFVTFLFENRETIRFQIQEMARAEKIISDEGIETELRIYNPLIPEPGHLAATMFIELTNEADMREWFPKLVGIETQVEFRVSDGSAVRCTVDPEHAEQLTREDTTAAVHYIHFSFTADQIDALAGGDVTLAVTHDNYSHETALGADTVTELLADLRG